MPYVRTPSPPPTPCPKPGQALRFEVLQHTPGQVRLWPPDPRFRRHQATPETEAEWRQAKLRHPVGSTVSARVEHVFPFNDEYWIRFTADDSPHHCGTLLPWTGEQHPKVRTNLS